MKYTSMYLPPPYYSALRLASERLSMSKGRPIRPGQLLVELIAKGLASHPDLADLDPSKPALE